MANWLLIIEGSAIGYRLSAIGASRKNYVRGPSAALQVLHARACERWKAIGEWRQSHLARSVLCRTAMTPLELRERTAQFAVDVTTLARTFNREPAADIVVNQLLRSATGTAANYRAAGQARSHAEFTSRISVVLEEADECIHWLEFVERAGLARGVELTRLIRESKELAAIFGASRRTASTNAKAHAASNLREKKQRRR